MTTRTWQWHEAKSKFDEVVEQALVNGPQLITKRSKDHVVVLSYQEYYKLLPSGQKLSKFFRESPLVGLDLELDRDKRQHRSDVNQ